MFDKYLGQQIARWRYLWNRPKSPTASGNGSSPQPEPVAMEIREYITEELDPYRPNQTYATTHDKHSFYVCVGPFASINDVKSGLSQMMLEWPVRPGDTAMI